MEMIYSDIKSGKENIILMVPEQASFQTEKSMLDFLGNYYFDKIKVLSFSRLFDFVSCRLDIPNIVLSNSIKQIVIMSQALDKLKSKLKIYKKNANDIFLAKLLMSTINEFKSRKIDKNSLYKIKDSCEGKLLNQKIEEIILIYETYENLNEDILKDNFDALDLLDKIIKQSKIFENYTIYFDGFSDFSNQQFSILESILVQSEKVYMAFCTDSFKLDFNTSQYNLFQRVDNTIYKIKKISKENSIKIKEIEFLEKSLRFKSQELSTLEKNIFRSKKKQGKNSPKDISLYRALDINEECDYVARSIKKLIIDKKYRYKDFAILTRDISLYSNILKSSLEKYSLPYFLDASEILLNKNLTNFIIGAFDAVHSDYSGMEVLRYLKSGLTGISNEEISILENYVLLWNVNSEKWSTEFSMHPGGWYQDFELEDLETLEKLNQIRERVIEPLKKFQKSITSATGREIAEAVYNLLVDVNAAENLRTFCDNISNKEDNQIAEKHAMLWDTVMDVLSQITTVLGSHRISSRKYLEIFTSSLNSLDVAFVPQSSDSVFIASIERSRLSSPKVVYVVGAADGEFPKTPETLEIFSDYESDYLSSIGIEMKESKQTFLIKEKFLAYIAVSAPSDMLFVTWHTVDLVRKNKLPSEIVKEIISIFPEARIFTKNDMLNDDEILSLSDALKIYMLSQDYPGELYKAVRHYLYGNEKQRKKCEGIKKFLNKERLNFQSFNNSSELFGKNITLSASQIEKYYTCNFGYYCKYGLEIKPLPKSKFGALDYGTLIHFLLEKILKKYIDGGHYEDIAKDKLKAEIDVFIDKYVSEKLGGWKDKPKSFYYLINRFKDSIVFLVNRLSEEFKQSKFKIFGTELEISKSGIISPLTFNLSENRTICVEGKVDRIDIMREENKEYVRVIDYKTGFKDFKLSDLLYGINMQMLIYLLAIHKNGLGKNKNILPAGVLYFKALKPIVDVQRQGDYKKSELEMKKKLKMDGLVLENKDVILGMEKEAKGEFIPVAIRNEEIKKSDSLVDSEELDVIYKHIENLIIKVGNDMVSGKFSACPVISKGNKACKWCEYFSVCLIEDNNFIKLPSSMSKEEVIEKMKRGEVPK